MSDWLLWLIAVASILNAVLTGTVLIRLLLSAQKDAHATVVAELRAGREETAKSARELREEVSGSMKDAAETNTKTLGEMWRLEKSQLEEVTKQLKGLTESNEKAIEAVRKTIETQFKTIQENNEKKLDEMRNAFKAQLEDVGKELKAQTESNQKAMEAARNTIETQLKAIQESNEKKLDEMRKTVDEKLEGTLEKRLGESFKLVSERLEAVQRGLGEMQNLATGVGDLKRVLTNVKARGTWGEVQLGAILEQVLTPDQYARNVQTKDDSRESVEYAIRLPGPDGHSDSCVWLPIDSKFPHEDYVRLLNSAEIADAEGVQKATVALVRAVRNSAQEIRDKYLNPPRTTDFALMFLATEGLYAEVLRQPGLVEELQQSYRIVVSGPTTLSAILSSLRMGFRTLAIEQRASEVWKVLAAVKTEFGKFGEILDRVKKQLNTASRTIEETGVRTRAMERKLRDVEQLPFDEATQLLSLENELAETSDSSGDGADSSADIAAAAAGTLFP